MELRDTPEEAAFRAELRAWLDANLPGDRRGGRGGEERYGDGFGREWSRLLYKGGYAGLTWPKEYGGADHNGPWERCAEAGAPRENPLRRGDLVPGILRAGRGLRPRRRAHTRRA